MNAGENMSQTISAKAPRRPLTARPRASESISTGNGERRCLTCETMFVSSNRLRVFCSDRCRLLFWSAKQVVSAVRSGNAAGLAAMLVVKSGRART